MKKSESHRRKIYYDVEADFESKTILSLYQINQAVRFFNWLTEF